MVFIILCFCTSINIFNKRFKNLKITEDFNLHFYLNTQDSICQEFFQNPGSNWGQTCFEHKKNPRNRPYCVDL